MSAAFTHLVEVMDRLRSPGGCPWDAEQDHRSLLTYLVEETYELIDAIETDDRSAMLEELGDVLLQVVFHARIAQEDPESPFSIDDVARVITEKLIARHPHVFDESHGPAESAAAVAGNWEKLKAKEKGRSSAVDGIPMGQPALALAQKLLHRLDKHDMPHQIDEEYRPLGPVTPESIGAALMAVVDTANAHGIDAEGALRATARGIAERASGLG